MTVAIDLASAVPPYDQVRGQLAAKINDGAFPVGAKLPTVRALASELGLAVNTVARAYRELEEAGLIETRGRAGSFVAANGDSARSRAAQAATVYVTAVTRLGITPQESLEIVRAALGQP